MGKPSGNPSRFVAETSSSLGQTKSTKSKTNQRPASDVRYLTSCHKGSALRRPKSSSHAVLLDESQAVDLPFLVEGSALGLPKQVTLQVIHCTGWVPPLPFPSTELLHQPWPGVD